MGGSSEIFRAGLLAGQAAIVTGGGTNLGRQAAAELLACGADVVIAGRREEVLEEAGMEVPDDQEEEVEKFREFLDQINPEDFEPEHGQYGERDE